MAVMTSLSNRAQTPHYKVYAIRFASMAHPTPISMWSDKGPDNDSVQIDFSIWLIKGDNGKNILVDAGFRSDITEAKEFEVANYIRPDSALAKVGLKPGDITDIILSHPHWDHIDGSDFSPTPTSGSRRKITIISSARPGPVTAPHL